MTNAFCLSDVGATPALLNVSSGLLHNLDSLKESMRLAGSGSYDWQNIDMSQFQGNAAVAHFLVPRPPPPILPPSPHSPLCDFLTSL